jgi:hypothetical protein
MDYLSRPSRSTINRVLVSLIKQADNGAVATLDL